MDYQHRKITGYRDLSEAEIELINEIKQTGASLEALTSRLRTHHTLDQRWVNIGTTDLQKGIMALVRSVAQPESF